MKIRIRAMMPGISPAAATVAALLLLASTVPWTAVALPASAATRLVTSAAARVISGRVLAPDGKPVSAEPLVIVVNGGEPASGAWVQPPVLGSAVTNAKGDWRFTVPLYAALPAAARALARGNGGYLNVEALALSSVTVSGTSYVLGTVAARSAWVGTPARSDPPAGAVSAAEPAMTMRPDEPSVSAAKLQAGEAATWVSRHDPEAANARGQVTGQTWLADEPAPVDRYGFQVVGDDPGFNPNVAANGTNLTSTGILKKLKACYRGTVFICTLTQKVINTKLHAYTAIGQFDTGWRESGSLSYKTGASSDIGASVSFTVGAGPAWAFSGYDTFSRESSGTSGEGTPAGSYDDSRMVLIDMHYWESSWQAKKLVRKGDGYTHKLVYAWKQWDEHGAYSPPMGQFMTTGGNVFGKISAYNAQRNPWLVDGNGTYVLDINGRKQTVDIGAQAAIDWHRKWVSQEKTGWYYTLDHGHGQTYGIAASIGGIGIQADTAHTTLTEQDVDTRPFKPADREDTVTGKRDGLHWVWGSDGKLFKSDPGTFFSY